AGLGAEAIPDHPERARQRLGHARAGVVRHVRCFSWVGCVPRPVARADACTARRVASTTLGITSAGGRSTSAPDALMCPPPPNSRARAFTSTAPLARNEILVPPVALRRKS